MNVAVVVCIDVLEGLLIKLHPTNRAAQNRPQFLIQFVEMPDILTPLNVNAGHSTYRGKLPIIITHKQYIVSPFYYRGSNINKRLYL